MSWAQIRELDRSEIEIGAHGLNHRRLDRLPHEEASDEILGSKARIEDRLGHAIRHFAYGIGDDNPLWLDRQYANRSQYASLTAPPSFLASVLYPGLHGFPMAVPLSSLISELGFEWYRPLLEGETLHARAQQLDVRESTSRQGRRLVYVLAEITYSNDRGEVVGKANSTMARVEQHGPALLVDRPTYRYSNAELQAIKDSLRSETRTGRRVLPKQGLRTGCELPALVRAPK